jgi:hypothetical protein
VAVQSTGKILVGQNVPGNYQGNSLNSKNICRINSDGTLKINKKIFVDF